MSHRLARAGPAAPVRSRAARPPQRVLRSLLASSFLLLSIAGAQAGADDQLRSFKNENVGNVTLVAPKDWGPVERHHIKFGTTFYRLVPPKAGQFELEILVNDLAHMQMEALVDKDLELYIQTNMAAAVPQSVEGRVASVRFGAQRDGVYARLTDKAPKPGEFSLFTQGVRLQGNRVVLFTLYSNDKDGSVLRRALDIVSSVRFER